MPDWAIALDSWVVQDENYGDFSSGQRAEFALEFEPERDLEVSKEDAPSVRHLRDELYEVTATVRHSDEEFSVIDFGLQAYAQHPPLPEGATPGQSVKGTVGLGVDPFTYFEGLASLPGAPPLIYTWNVLSIRRQGAPWLKGQAAVECSGEVWSTAPTLIVNGELWVRDPKQWRWVEIDQTDAWNDDEGHAHYLLDCRLLSNEPPKRTR